MTDMNSFYNDARDVLGEEFFKEIAGLIPMNGPRIDVYETATKVVVFAELPGLDSPDQIGIMLEGQALHIEGEIPRMYPVTDNKISQQERFFGTFQRTLSMPRPVLMEGITARYSKGLLAIELSIDMRHLQTNIQVDFQK